MPAAAAAVTFISRDVYKVYDMNDNKTTAILQSVRISGEKNLNRDKTQTKRTY